MSGVSGGDLLVLMKTRRAFYALFVRIVEGGVLRGQRQLIGHERYLDGGCSDGLWDTLRRDHTSVAVLNRPTITRQHLSHESLLASVLGVSVAAACCVQALVQPFGERTR